MSFLKRGTITTQQYSDNKTEYTMLNYNYSFTFIAFLLKYLYDIQKNSKLPILILICILNNLLNI